MKSARFFRTTEPRFWHPDGATGRTVAPEGAEPHRSELYRWLVAGWLVALGGAALVIGGHDALRGDEIAVTIIGTLLALAGLVIASGGLLLAGTRAIAGPAVAAVGCVLGVVLGVMLALTQVTNDRAGPGLLGWIAISIASAFALWLLRHELSRSQRAGMWSGLKVLASFVTVGVLLSAAQFWYGSIYVPSTAPPSLTMTMRLEPAGELGDRVALRGSVTVANTSGTRVNTLASLVEAYGVGVSAQHLASEDFWPQLSDASAPPQHGGALGGDATTAERYSNEYATTVVYARKLLAEGTYFQPGETITVPVTVYLPAHRFDAVRAYASIAFARATLRLDLDRAQMRSGSEGVVVTSTPVQEDGWLRNLTRSDRYLRIRRTIDADAAGVDFDISFSPFRDRPGPTRFDERMQRFYGYSTANASFELSEWSPAGRSGG